MKTNIILLSLLLSLVSCAGFGQSNMSKEDANDVANGEKYPECHHQYKTVFRKCVALNDNGQKVDAMRTEQLMREDKAN